MSFFGRESLYIKDEHPVKLITALESLKNRKVVCDFEVRVKRHVYPAHRAVLAACSKYFEGMLTSNMKEANQGYVDIEHLNAKAVESCINFMYSGELQAAPSEAPRVLEAAHFIQLDDLTEICLKLLKDSLSVKNCWVVSRLFLLYGTLEDQTLVKDFTIKNFGDTVKTDEFRSVGKEDILRYLNHPHLGCELRWKALITWLKDRESASKEAILLEAMGCLFESKTSSLKFLFANVWKNREVVCRKHVKTSFIENLSQNCALFEKDLNLTICFALCNEIGPKNALPLKHAIFKHIAMTFKRAMQFDAFYRVLRHQDMTDILTSSYLVCEFEPTKWEAIIKWVKMRAARWKNLPELMKLISYEKIRLDYIEKNIRGEKLVKQSLACKDVLLDAYYRKASTSIVTVLVTLDEGSGIMTASDNSGEIWEIGRIKPCSLSKISFLQGKLYLFRDNELWICNADKWENVVDLTGEMDDFIEILAFEDRMFLIGSSQMFLFNPSEKTLKKMLPGCSLGREFCVAASRSSIYALGGCDSPYEARGFETKNGEWIKLPKMRFPREGAAAAVYNDNLYVMGGALGWQTYNHVERYCPAARFWTTVTGMRFSRYSFSAVVLNNQLLVVGGCDENDDFEVIECYKENDGRWLSRKAMRKSTGVITACVCHVPVNFPILHTDS